MAFKGNKQNLMGQKISDAADKIIEERLLAEKHKADGTSPATKPTTPEPPKKNLGGRPPGTGKHQIAAALAEKGVLLSPVSAGVAHAEVWTQFVCASIIAKQVRSAHDLALAVAIADSALDIFKERFDSKKIKHEL